MKISPIRNSLSKLQIKIIGLGHCGTPIHNIPVYCEYSSIFNVGVALYVVFIYFFFLPVINIICTVGVFFFYVCSQRCGSSTSLRAVFTTAARQSSLCPCPSFSLYGTFSSSGCIITFLVRTVTLCDNHLLVLQSFNKQVHFSVKFTKSHQCKNMILMSSENQSLFAEYLCKSNRLLYSCILQKLLYFVFDDVFLQQWSVIAVIHLFINHYALS